MSAIATVLEREREREREREQKKENIYFFAKMRAFDFALHELLNLVTLDSKSGGKSPFQVVSSPTRGRGHLFSLSFSARRTASQVVADPMQ